MAAKERNPRPTGVRRFDDHEATTSLLSASCQSVRPHTAGSSNIGPMKVEWRSYQSEDFDKKIHQVEDQIYDLEDRRNDDILFSHTRKRRTSLLAYDLALMVIEYLSTFALLLSSSLRWTWPADWITAMGWTFLINLDLFEFAKVYTPNVYASVQGSYTKSSSVPVPFWGQLLVWAILTVILVVVFLGVYLYLWRRRTPRYHLQMACLRRVYLLITQFLALPAGATFGKIYHCTSTNLFDVDNSLQCFGGAHWAYIIIVTIFALAFYFLIPAYMIYRTDRQIISLTTVKHEAYLRLKEHEYKRGLDALWYISEFFIFSSFRRLGVFYRPVMHMLKLVLVIVYGALFNSMQIQGILFCVIFFLIVVVFALVRPYRVRLLNIYLIFCYACLGTLALMGAMRASFTVFSVSSAFLLPTYTTGVLGIIMGVWLIGTICVIALAIKHRRSLWPTLDVDKLELDMQSDKVDPTTRKFVKAVLRAKAVIEYAVSMPSIFAPVHEISRQILLVNALFREAEASKDPLQDTLWDILEELSQLHARLLPRSLFAESVKPSVRRTAAEFLALMPQLARRLHQREYDFIMVHPIRRRILFKLYILSLFLRGAREVREREMRVNERVNRVWRSKVTQDDVYYPHLYPEEEDGPSILTVSMPIAHELRKDDDRRELGLMAISNSLVDLTEADEECEQSVSDMKNEEPGGVENEAFDDNEHYGIGSAHVGISSDQKLQDDLSESQVQNQLGRVPTTSSGPPSRLSTQNDPSGQTVENRVEDEKEATFGQHKSEVVMADGQESRRPGSGSTKAAPQDPVLVEIGDANVDTTKGLAPIE